MSSKSKKSRKNKLTKSSAKIKRELCPFHGTVTVKQTFYCKNKHGENVAFKGIFCPKCDSYYSKEIASSYATSIDGKNVYKLKDNYTAATDRALDNDPPIHESEENITKFGPTLSSIPVVNIFQGCPVCHEKYRHYAYVTFRLFSPDAIEKSANIKMLYCPKCKVPAISRHTLLQEQRILAPNQFNYFEAENGIPLTQIQSRMRPASVVQTVNSEKYRLLREHIFNPNISELPASRYIEVYAKKCTCSTCEQRYGNVMSSETAVVKTVDNRDVKVNVMFCRGCGRYFMNYETFKAYNKAFGGLLCEFRLDPAISARSGSWSGFAPDSVLSRCGYTVKDKTPKEYRHAVLRYVLNSERASKAEIVQLITSFIHAHKNTHPAACERWKSDILYVNNYKLEKQQTVSGLKFIQGKH